MNTQIVKPEQVHSITRESVVMNNPPPIAAFIQAAIEKGVTSESVQAVAELVKLDREMRADRAKVGYAEAFKALQASMPQVAVSKPIPDGRGGVKFHIAPFEDIMQQVQPHLCRHGFSVTFSSDYHANPNRVVVKCTIIHEGGHERTSEFAVRIGNGPPGATDSQADGSAITYGKRYALCGALNIVIDHDNDARQEGATISPVEAQELEQMVHASGADKARILKLAGAAKFSEIRRAKYDVVMEQLDRMGKTQAGPEADADEFADVGVFDAAMNKLAAAKKWTPEETDAVLGAWLKKIGEVAVADTTTQQRRDCFNKINTGGLDKWVADRRK